MKPLLPLCSIPRLMNRDGYSGAHAKLLLPFEGYVQANGALLSFSGGTALQYASPTIHGTNMADAYQKDCCSTCLGH